MLFETKLVQAGQAPKLMFYVAGHPSLGSMILTTANGSLSSKSAQHGLKRWTDRISADERLRIMELKYGNTDEAVEKLREKNPTLAATLFPPDVTSLKAEDFDIQGFLVSSITRQRLARSCARCNKACVSNCS